MRLRERLHVTEISFSLKLWEPAIANLFYLCQGPNLRYVAELRVQIRTNDSQIKESVIQILTGGRQFKLNSAPSLSV